MKPAATVAVAITAALSLLSVSPILGKPVHKKALADYFGPFLAAKLNDCRTCHLPDKGEGGSEKPHNPFGARLAALKAELSKAGKQSDIAARLEAAANEDSDGDGVSNLVELLTGHFPGDPQDKPTAAELADAPKLLAAFRKHLDSHRWNPFEPVQRRIVPQVKNTAWVRNPIDAFIAAEHEARGLTPRPDAPKSILLRRVSLDLIGLPPTREELHAFLADDSPDAYEKVVDRLLASPQYGERWGRHWMDVWRYADWSGYGAEVRDSQKHVWRWRDWIIESLNQDKGYDRMVVEMLAGDELEPTNPDVLRATGFLVRNWYKFNRNVWLDNTVEHTAKAFLGVTMNCARCHDHFFDPISQQEYYRMRAFFEPYDVRTDRLPGQADLDKDGLPRAYDAQLTTPTYLFVRGNEATPDKATALTPGVPAALGGSPLQIEPVTLPLIASAPDKRNFVIAETIAAAQNNLAAAKLAVETAQRMKPVKPELVQTAELSVRQGEFTLTTLLAVLQLEHLEDEGQKESELWQKLATETAQLQRELAVATARVNLDAARQGVRTANDKTKADAEKKVGDAELALAKVEADLKLPPTTAYTKRPIASYAATSSGRRLALARWISDGQNPLTGRVAVNHVWLRHFGKALVPTVFDFGRNGQTPTHPTLLDWLAAEFVRSGWSQKALHRLMVTSSAYRLDSTPDATDLATDPDNRILWRMNSRRMEAELVRDSVLHVAGNLDLHLGGADIDHTQGLTVPRRSLYFRHAAEKQMEFLQLFDAANVTECYRRNESIVPQQALALANSPLSLAQARLLARRLSQEVGTTATEDPAFVTAAFEQVLSREPTAREREECVKFLTEQTALLLDRGKLSGFGAGPPCPVPPATDPHLRARENLTHVLLNHHDFVTIR
jgi:hypothetical protein